jgi:hypothetical protein
MAGPVRKPSVRKRSLKVTHFSVDGGVIAGVAARIAVKPLNITRARTARVVIVPPLRRAD